MVSLLKTKTEIIFQNFFIPLFLHPDIKKKEENNENTKQSLDHQTSLIQQSTVPVSQNIVHSQSHHQTTASLVGLTIPQTHQQLSWSCELCGRMFSTRDEWSVHAKSHLEVRYFCLSLFLSECILYILSIF